MATPANDTSKKEVSKGKVGQLIKLTSRPWSINTKKNKATNPPRAKKANQRAFDSAIVLRSLTFGIVGQKQPFKVPDGTNQPRPAYNRIKSDLLNPQLANKVIVQLQSLPAPDGPTSHMMPLAPSRSEHVEKPAIYPIQAVCLDCTDDEAEKVLFKRLNAPPQAVSIASDGAANVSSIAHTELSNVVALINEVKLVNLLEAPDFGLGQTAESKGILAGSLPSPETVSAGFNQITQQLMALGFATSNAVFPNHAGLHPPQDRMSVITYWWGLEIALPPPSIEYLSKVSSISHAVLNILSALALVNNGVREILPFVRYISQFMDFEWGAIKAQNKGQGVVCAATWIMPAALIPRPWDFAPPPPPKP